MKLFLRVKMALCCHVTRQSSFVFMFILTASYFLVELVVGYYYNSLVLQADAFHMFSDVLSLVIGFLAYRLGKKNAVNVSGFVTNTYGWVRAEIVGALVNSVFLIALCFTIFLEAIVRFSEPKRVDQPMTVLAVGVVGLVINIVGILLFHDHAHGHGHHHSSHDVNNEVNNINRQEVGFEMENTQKRINLVHSDKNSSSRMNMKGVYLHILGDLFGSVFVIFNALLVLFIKDLWVVYMDPLMSLVSVLILLFSAVPLCKNSIMILIQTVPTGINVKEIKHELLQKYPQITGAHDFHVWRLAGEKIIASIHLIFSDYESYASNITQLKAFFHDRGIHSITIQAEFHRNSVDTIKEEDFTCLLQCPTGDGCRENQCCNDETY